RLTPVIVPGYRTQIRTQDIDPRCWRKARGDGGRGSATPLARVHHALEQNPKPDDPSVTRSRTRRGGITDKMPMSDPRQLLQGRAPGVTLVQSSGVVGGGSRMRIRGSGSLNAGNEPVVYVDGVRVQSGQVRTEGNTSQPINLLDSFNPNAIESIEVIKGPAAAARYGAGAASGVIQIVTKKGRKAEGLQWTANFEYGRTNWATDQSTNYWLCTDARMADLERNPGCGVFTGDEPLEQRLLIDQPLNPKARSKGVLYQYQQRGITEDYPCLFPEQAPCTPSPLRTGTTQNINVSVRGGGDSYNFYLSGEKSDQEGTFHNNY